ncbi:MAG: hypothetical protein U0W65_12665 [Bacteroidia bacterium]|nr:hypothetical protein [Bacteroidia bacterium]
MKQLKKILLVLVTASAMTLFYACKKDKDSKPIISISPASIHLYVDVNDLLTFKVSVSSEVPLTKVVIKGTPSNQTPITLLDTAIATKGTSFNFYYRVPASMAGQSMLITFRAEDQNGMASENFCRIYVNSVNPIHPVPLTETSGHRMYSNLSTNPDSYNLETNTGDFSTVVDTASRDIQDYSGSSLTLSNSWISPAGGKFVKYNGFDYANATDSTTIAAYSSGVKLSVLNSLQVGDIIITKLGSVSTNKYVLMRITDIVDVTGKDNDYYEFSIKK